MAAKQILFDTEARQAVQRGIRELARAVKVTLGPNGHVVVLSEGEGAGPTATKDGVTVAKAVELADRYENSGVQLVREVALRTSKLAGDGTTTATIYAEAIFDEGLKNVTAGANGNEIRRGIEAAVSDLGVELRRVARPADDAACIEQVARCSANDDGAIGRLVAEAAMKVGKEGIITVDEGTGLRTMVEETEGMHFDRGYLSPHFVNDAGRMSVVLQDALVFIHEKGLSKASDIVPVLELASQARKPLLIVAEDVTGEALSVLVTNRLRAGLEVCAVKAPGFGDRRRAWLEDMAVLTGGRAIAQELHLGPENITIDNLGRVEKVLVDRESTTLIGGAGDSKHVQKHAEMIAQQLSTAAAHEQEALRQRLAALRGRIAQIRVGGATEPEVREKVARVENAVHASRAAMEEGVVPGGGSAVLHARKVLRETRQRFEGDARVGVDIVCRALSAPLFQIAENSGVSGSVTVGRVAAAEDASYGFDAITGRCGDMSAMGILVPAKVERVALEQAASIAGLLLTTDVIISELA